MGVVLYDNKNKIGGMLHLMLAKCNDRAGKLSKYADTGIPLLVDLMVNKTNANKKMLTAILDYEGVVRCTTLKQIRNHLYIIKDHL